MKEVDVAVIELRASSSRVQAGRRAVAQGEESLRVEQEEFAQGRGISNDLLLAQEALLRARTELSAALAAGQIARAELDLAIGEAPAQIGRPYR